MGGSTIRSRGESGTFRCTPARGGTGGRAAAQDVLCASISLALLTVFTIEQMCDEPWMDLVLPLRLAALESLGRRVTLGFENEELSDFRREEELRRVLGVVLVDALARGDRVSLRASLENSPVPLLNDTA